MLKWVIFWLLALSFPALAVVSIFLLFPKNKKPRAAKSRREVNWASIESYV